MENRKFNGLKKRPYGELTGGELVVTYLRFFACLTVLLASQNVPGAEQTGGEVAAELKRNVVRITTLMADSNTGPGGFGFIVGEKNHYLYIVTAKHVVLESHLDNPIEQRFVQFFGQPQENPVSVEYVGAAPLWDLALLKAAKPRDFAWQPQSMAPQGTSQRESRVWFVGKGSSWFVPTDAAVGTINRIHGNGMIDIDMLSVLPGTSGAPLITQDGIAGMVLMTEEDVSAEALSIDAIKSAFEKYNVWEAYPWSLRSFPPCLEAPPGLVHWWPGDGNTNDIVSGNHGMQNGLVSFDSGKVGEAFAFDGMESYVVSSDAISQSGRRPRTISAWIKADASVAGILCCPTPYSWGEEAKGKSFGIFSSLGSWHFWGNVDSSENFDIRIGSAPRAEWEHHTITYNSSEVVYYIDGTVVAQADRKLNTSSTPIYMGRAFVRRPIGDTPFKGMLDEIQIYSRSLSPEEVKDMHDAGRGGVCKKGMSQDRTD